MAQAIDEISNMLENIKLAKDNFLGKDLSVERNFCDVVSEQVGKELKDCEVSTFLGKKKLALNLFGQKKIGYLLRNVCFE